VEEWYLDTRSDAACGELTTNPDADQLVLGACASVRGRRKR
jgi:hypothetical protein